MSFSVNLSNGRLLTDVPDQTKVTTQCSLTLVGRGAANYAQSHCENFVHLLENFAGEASPATPIVGQLWFEKSDTTQQMKLWNGDSWVPVGGGGTGTTGVLAQGSRQAGFTGAVLVTPTGGKITVGVALAEGEIVALISSQAIGVVDLPSSTIIDGQTYLVSQYFPAGVNVGFNLSSMPNNAYRTTSADLAERYEASEALEPGDVVEIGGKAEIQKVRGVGSTDVFGVISTAPGMLLNSGAGTDQTHPAVALTGRVPCKVIGSVRKGQRLRSSSAPGVAEAAPKGAPSEAIIGRALVDKTTPGVELIEIVVATGR